MTGFQLWKGGKGIGERELGSCFKTYNLLYFALDSISKVCISSFQFKLFMKVTLDGAGSDCHAAPRDRSCLNSIKDPIWEIVMPKHLLWSLMVQEPCHPLHLDTFLRKQCLPLCTAVGKTVLLFPSCLTNAPSIKCHPCSTLFFILLNILFCLST